MSKSIVTEALEYSKSHKMSGNRDGDYEGKENEEGILDVPQTQNLTTSTTVSAAPAVVNEFMHTPEFRRYFVEFVHVQTLIALRFATKAWKVVAEKVIDEGVRRGELFVHDGKDTIMYHNDPLEERRKLVTRVSPMALRPSVMVL
ncbi:hypothetical protein TL16_g02917 [Triparma laevis f. inornata]|uniref:Uncharacterized protein n=2 Tax=Triparma laevis TaxID=1534972 RepID=A0A9W7EEF0_9STRA|nr:hypothetical protein TL16_g02917 [Triparma laevis f. inornata]GMH74990.1 hypothetical protein TrLO_g8782 [Triparma laevis f. longispina]